MVQKNNTIPSGPPRYSGKVTGLVALYFPRSLSNSDIKNNRKQCTVSFVISLLKIITDLLRILNNFSTKVYHRTENTYFLKDDTTNLK